MITDKPSEKFLLDLLMARALGGKDRRRQNRRTDHARLQRQAQARRGARDAANALKPAALSNHQRVQQGRMSALLSHTMAEARRAWEKRAERVYRFVEKRPV